MSLWSEVKCPVCKSRGARKLLWMVRCPRNGCPNYRPGLPAAAPKPAPKPLTGSFSPGANAIVIRYTNHEGEKKTYTGDRTTIRASGKFISLLLVPTGERCSFSRDRVANMREVEPFVAREDLLTSVERQILGYHRKNGTTSPRFEDVKRKLATAR